MIYDGKIRITKEDVERVYDEFDRRIKEDIKDGTIPMDEKAIHEEAVTRLQGVYGTLMALVSNEHWITVSVMIDQVEAERYGECLYPVCL